MERAVHEGGVRAIVNMPPRHGKSQLIARWGTTYALDVDPSTEVMLLAYGSSLAEGWSRQIREDLGSPDHRAEVHPASSKVSKWNTTEGGQVLAAGLGGAVTGEGADLVIVDDPFKNRAEAESPAVRERVWNNFTSAVMTRLSPRASVIISHTRWHEDDLSGRCLRQDSEGYGEGWERINLPGLAEDGDLLGRAPGEALWPARFNADRLRKLRGLLGERDFQSIYQGRPRDGGAGFFPPFEKWPRWRTLPDSWLGWRLVLSVDTTFKDGPASDPVDISTWAISPNGKAWLVDNLNSRLGLTGTTSHLRSLLETLPVLDVVVEEKAMGSAVIEFIRQHLPEVSVYAYNPRVSKEARAAACSGLIEMGDVIIPHPSAAPWITDWEREVGAFPVGKHDDRVDTMTQFLIAAFIERTLGGAEPLDADSMLTSQLFGVGAHQR